MPFGAAPQVERLERSGRLAGSCGWLRRVLVGFCASWVCAAVECTVGRSISLAGGFERALTRARGAIVLACGLVRRFVWACASRVRLLILAGYLVDPASSHMLVSKIKPCMSKYKRLYCETANGSLNQLWFI